MSPTEPSRAARRGRRRAAAVAAGLACGLLAGEVGARVLAAWQDRLTLERALAAEVPIPADRVVQLGHLVRLSAAPGIPYELRPDLERLVYAGAEVSTNAQGFRDREHPPAPPPGSVRIVGLGDSVMFGQGVRQGREYLTRLEELLAERRPTTAFEAVNTAVPGYNTATEVAVLEQRGLAYAPDLVIVGFVENDANLPSFVRTARDPFEPGRSFLWELVRARRPAAPALVAAPTREVAGRRRVEDDPERVPPALRDAVGQDSIERGLERLAELGREHGFEVLVFAHRANERSTRALERARELGLHALSLTPVVEAFMERRGIERYRGSVLTVSESDPHPSAVQHRLAAEALADYLEESGLLDALVEASG